MAMYNSFYGGRRGTSFVIVKNYLDIPQMVNAFSQGNDCTEVNFEEYVIINNPNKNHPDNGKVFRRGYDFNSNRTISGYVFYANDDSTKAPIILSSEADYRDKLEDKEHYSFEWRENIQAHGAEYVGTIIGPAGKAPLLTLGSYEQVQNKSQTAFEERRSRGHYSPVGDTQSIKEEEQSLADWEQSSEESINTISLIPGKDGNGFHDSIEWYCVSVRNDDYGDNTQAYIGFKFPYLVTQMQTKQVSPYDENGNIADMSRIARADDDPGTHPYYNKWHLKIPKGVPGDALRNLRITTFNGYSGNATNSDEKGPLYYCVKDSGETIKQKLIYFDEQHEGHFNRQFFEKKYGTDIVSEGITLIELLNKLTDKAILVYEKYNFDNKQNGEVEYYYLGDYNEIKNIELSEEGKLICTLAHDGEKILNPNDDIRWIHDISFELPYNIEEISEEDDNGNIIQTGTQLIFKPDKGTNNFIIEYNTKNNQQERITKDFNIPFVKRIVYDRQSGNLYYQLAGLHDKTNESDIIPFVENNNDDIEGIPLTTLEYLNSVDYDSNSSTLTFYYNNYDENERPDNKIEKIIPAIKRIQLQDVAYENIYDEQDNLVTRPCLVAEYKDSNIEGQSISRTEIIADNFDYLESFNYDDNDGSLNYKKKSGSALEKHIIPFVDKLQYDDDTAQIRYHVNGDAETQYEELEGNLPIIKDFEIDEDTKDIYIQFGTAFNAFEGNPKYSPKGTKYINPQDHWYRIGSAISKEVVMGGILTNFTLAQLNERLRGEGLDEITNYEGAESQSYNENNPNPVIQALNNLFSEGIVTIGNEEVDTSLRVITVGEENQFKEYFAYDWMKIREEAEEDDGVASYGSWYFLGRIKAINNVNLAKKQDDIKQGTLSFVAKEDICLIDINIIGALATQYNIKNPMTKIQSNHNYKNIITGSFNNTSVSLKIGGISYDNLITFSSNQVSINIPANNVSGDITIEINRG